MGLEDALAGSHRYSGLRAYGFGQSIEMQWPEHPNFPTYGYTITRHDLDGLVAEQAARPGPPLLQGTEVVAPILDEARRPVPGPLPTLRRRHRSRTRAAGGTRAIRARYVVVADGANSRIGRMLGTSRRRDLPDGHGPARLLHARSATTTPSSSPTSTSATPRATSCPATAGSSPWATAGSTSASACSRPTALEGRQHHPADGRLRGLRPRVLGPAPRDLPRPAHRRQAAHGPLGRAPGRRERAHRRRRRRRHQPVQRRGHRLRLRDRPPGRRRARPGADRRGRRGPGGLRARARAPPTGRTTRWPGPSSA